MGFDLGQLLIGLVHSGELTADSAFAFDPGIISAFSRGLSEDGISVPVDELVYGHHGSLLARAGFTAFPFERLGEPPTYALHNLFAQRAALTRNIVNVAVALSD